MSEHSRHKDKRQASELCFHGTVKQVNASFPQQLIDRLNEITGDKVKEDTLWEIHKAYLVCQPYKTKDPYLFPSMIKKILEQLHENPDKVPACLRFEKLEELSEAGFKILTLLRRAYNAHYKVIPPYIPVTVFSGSHELDGLLLTGHQDLKPIIKKALEIMPIAQPEENNRSNESFFVCICNLFYSLTEEKPAASRGRPRSIQAKQLEIRIYGKAICFIEEIYRHYGLEDSRGGLQQRLERINKGGIKETKLGIKPDWL